MGRPCQQAARPKARARRSRKGRDARPRLKKENAVIVNTRDFGPVEVPESKLLTMTEPILGFESRRRFTILDKKRTYPILWLQCVDDASLAFPIIEASLLGVTYAQDMAKVRLSDLGANNPAEVKLYLIVVIPEDVSQTRVNLRAPLIVNEQAGLAKQIVFYDTDYPIQFPIIQAANSAAEPVAC